MRHRVRAAAASASLVLVACVAAVGSAGHEQDDPRTPFAREDYFRWMKELSNWDRWGADDERGTLNLITADKMRQAAALVKAGVSVSLAQVQVPNRDDSDGLYGGQLYGMTMHVQDWEQRGSSQEFSSPPPEDLAINAHGGRSHIDALAHMFYNGQGYNGITYRDITEAGAARGAVDQMRHGIVTRGVLIDLPRLKGVPYLDSDARLSLEDLEAWEQQARVTVSSGDALFVRVGHWARRRATGDRSNRRAGFDPSVIPWLKQRGVAVLGSEGPSLEASHDGGPAAAYNLGPLPVHWFATVFLGMPVMDYLDLDELSEVAAQQQRWEFLVTIAPMPIRGGTGSPVNPIAVF